MLTGEFSRIEIEGFMARSGLLSRKWMAARLGMIENTLQRLLEKLDVFGMQQSRYVQGTEFIAESLKEDLVRHIPSLRFITFGNNTRFCERLHLELNKVGVEIRQNDQLFCSTSTKLQDYPREFSCCISIH